MANQVAGSQTKVAADVAQLKTDVESLNSKLQLSNGTCTSSYGTVSYRRYGQIIVLYFGVTNVPTSAWTDLSSDIPHVVGSAYGIAQTGDGRNNVSTYATGNKLRFYGRGSYSDATGTIVYLTDT